MRPPLPLSLGLPLAGEGVMAAEMVRSSGLEWYSVLSVACQNARLSECHSWCGPGHSKDRHCMNCSGLPGGD